MKNFNLKSYYRGKSKSGESQRRGSSKADSAVKQRPSPAAAYLRGATLSPRTATNKATTEREKLHNLTKRRQKVVRLITATLAVCALVALAIWQIIFNVQIEITNLSDQPDAKQLAAYQTAINQYLDKQPSERFKLFLNKKNLFSSLVDKSPEVASIDKIQTSFLQPSIFKLTLRQPVASWKVDGQIHFVDSQGVAFKTNYFPEPKLKIQDNSRANLTSDDAAKRQSLNLASSQFLKFVGRFIDLSKDKGYEVSEVVIPKTSLREINVKLKNNPVTIKASISRNAAEQVEDMDKSLKYLTKTLQQPAYLDVRVPRRAFYK